ncbi:hypothetical protein SAMN05421806_11687 [Streptomyces indicus]|uniref:Uncharacterized protein n=1 Tax=Streptomyces indicus TaxID=417292 RepID=A0A1G9GMB1_9ACTN|nr:hypothetical protein SAMN05421806_11687 [Streptomyces indicus]
MTHPGYENHVQGDVVHGDKVGRDQYRPGDHARITVTNQEAVSGAEINAAIAELRAFLSELADRGAITADGSVTDPGAVVTAVQAEPGRLRALTRAVAGGAREAVLSAVQGGVAAMVTALVRTM